MYPLKEFADVERSSRGQQNEDLLKLFIVINSNKMLHQDADRECKQFLTYLLRKQRLHERAAFKRMEATHIYNTWPC